MLDVNLSVVGYNPAPDAEVVYRITIKNNGSAPAYNFVLWDTLPGIMEYDSKNFGGSVVVDENNMVLFTLDEDRTIDPGRVLILDFTVKLETNQVPYIDNSISLDYNDQRYPPELGKAPPIQSSVIQYPGIPPIAYPNPYSSGAAPDGLIKFDNIVPGSIIEIYTVSGERVAIISSPSVKVYWNRLNTRGNSVSAGIYFYIVRNMYSQEYHRGKLFIKSE